MEYAKSPNWETRLHFATYPGLLPEVADFMIENEKNSNVFVRICIRLFEIPNSNIWPSTLAKAARKKVKLLGVNEDCDDALIRIALHLNTDVETLKYLYEINNKRINWGVANNPNTPKTILSELANINNFEIDVALLNNPNTPEEIKPTIRKRYTGFFSCGYHYTHYGIKVEASGN